MTNSKGMATMAVVIGIVGAVVGFVIVDSVITDTANTFTQLDTVTNNNQTLVALTQSNISTFNSIVQGGTTLPAANYTVILSPCCSINMTNLSSPGFDSANTTANVSYNYVKSAYFDSSLSRTIVSYVVPLGLMGVLAMAALVYL